ncbi:hypothetical protein VUR80DRAFT_7118 [Thermomyces stellatus]
MSVPAPPVPLQDSCAVLYDNTLYTYSANSFLRLKLEPDAEWEELSNGVQVKGGVCVGSTPADADEAGLYIVGGVASDDQYSGLQKFTYSTEEWKSIALESDVMKRRQWHGAAYLKSSDSILVYAGRVDDVQDFSSETFTIQAKAPYGVSSSPSNASPAISPFLLPWSDTDVVMVGGDPNNRRVMLFNAESQWWDSGATLADPIPKDASAITAMLIDGDDGSKSLYTFDMTQFPNRVTRVALIDANGEPIQNSPTLVGRDDIRLAARQSDSDGSTKPLTLDDWPEYDDSYASDEAWNNYAAAQDQDGMVVFARGNEDDPIRMFNARKNSWVDASLAFSEQERLGDNSVSSSGSSSSAPTSTSSSTSETAAGGEDDYSGISSNAILGIVLGSIVGILLLLGLLLFLIRRKRFQKQAGMNISAPDPGRSGPAMAARAASNTSRKYGYGHYPQNSNDSYSSMAILMNKTDQQNRGLGRNPSNGTNRSSMSSIFNKEFKSTISKPILQANTYSPAWSEKELEAGDRTTFFGPSLSKRVPRRPTVDSSTQPPAREPEAHDRSEDRMTVFGPSLSQRAPPRPPRGSATLGGPPLRPDAASTDPAERRSSGWNRYWSGGSALNILGFGGKRATMDSDDGSKYSDDKLNRVTQDSVTVPPLSMEPFSGRPELNRVHSGSPTVSQAPTQWPIMKEGMAGTIERPGSQGSEYTGYSSGIPESTYDTLDQGETKKPWGADRAPAAAYSGNGHSQPSSLDPSSTSGPAQIGISRQPPLKEAKLSTDMSWLNLGGNNRG